MRTPKPTAGAQPASKQLPLWAYLCSVGGGNRGVSPLYHTSPSLVFNQKLFESVRQMAYSGAVTFSALKGACMPAHPPRLPVTQLFRLLAEQLGTPQHVVATHLGVSRPAANNWAKGMS